MRGRFPGLGLTGGELALQLLEDGVLGGGLGAPARDSEAALENIVETLDTFSRPTPNVLTSFLTKLRVCGVILASDTAPLFSNATE